MNNKAVVFDNSGTLIERYRAIKDIDNNKIITHINSFDIIDNLEAGALVVLQFNSACLKNLNLETKIYDLIKENNIKFDISYSNCTLTKDKIMNILKNDKSTIKEISDCFNILKEKIPNADLCNGSALILDVANEKVAYTITTAGTLFQDSISTVNKLKNKNIDVFIASGDRAGAIKKLTKILNIKESHGFSTVDTKGKAKIVNNLKEKGYKVMMVGDAPNDVLAFDSADISVLTIEQTGKVLDHMDGKFDYCIDSISEVLNLVKKF